MGTKGASASLVDGVPLLGGGGVDQAQGGKRVGVVGLLLVAPGQLHFGRQGRQRRRQVDLDAHVRDTLSGLKARTSSRPPPKCPRHTPNAQAWIAPPSSARPETDTGSKLSPPSPLMCTSKVSYSLPNPRTRRSRSGTPSQAGFWSMARKPSASNSDRTLTLIRSSSGC